MKKKIAIIGSGIAGLTLANLLQINSDFDFIVYEKSEILNLDEGFGVQLSVNSISILNKIGFNQLNKSEKYHPSKLSFYSENLNKICDLDLTIFNSADAKYSTIKRSTLIKFLKEKLLSNSIIFRKKINKIEQINEKINIYFTDGSSDKVDYLVISDGVFSSTKSIVERKNFKPNYYGAVAIRAQTKFQDISKINVDNISLIMGSNFHFVIYPINQKKELNLVCIIRGKIEDKDSIKTILENTISKHNEDLINLFKSDLKSWPVYTTHKPTKSIYKNVLYMGDAFYTFPPTLAQGASQAIESANEIFELVNKSTLDMDNKYFKKRLKRINLISRRSKLNYFSFHLSNPIFVTFRNLILKRIIKNEKFLENYLGKIYKN
tara:strand:+ start:112 stop:1245 length:1134 start_codon:yes stop_codon:yes gene_type:complete